MEEFGDLSGAMLWRRKFLLPDPMSRRPAYFGSWRKTRYCSSAPCHQPPLAHVYTTPLVYQCLLETMPSGFLGCCMILSSRCLLQRCCPGEEWVFEEGPRHRLHSDER